MSESTYQDHGNVAKPIVGLADVIQPSVVKQNLLQNESGDRLRQLRACFHDSQTKWDDFGGKQKVNDLLLIGLHQRSDHTQAEKLES